MSEEMFDSIYPALLPPGAKAYAGYVDGRWPDFLQIRAAHPDADLVSIAVFADADADCLDVETGDATNADIYLWFKRQLARGVARPIIYTSANNVAAVNATMQANGFPRSSYRIWSAHYTYSPHICESSACGFPMADATQWTDQAGNCDESLMSAGFFSNAPAPPYIPEEDMPAVILLPGKTQPPVGVSFNGSPYTTIGLCGDPGIIGAASCSVRVAIHVVGANTWSVHHMIITPAAPKAVLALPPQCDGVSFTRDDDVALTLVPNFG